MTRSHGPQKRAITYVNMSERKICESIKENGT